jgi:hypothetical protein
MPLSIAQSTARNKSSTAGRLRKEEEVGKEKK